MAVKFTIIFHGKTIYPNWYFLFEKMPSGNPVLTMFSQKMEALNRNTAFYSQEIHNNIGFQDKFLQCGQNSKMKRSSQRPKVHMYID
jgi:hypothetical protein